MPRRALLGVLTAIFAVVVSSTAWPDRAAADDDDPKPTTPSRATRPAPARKTPEAWADEAFAEERVWVGQQLLVSDRRGRETTDATLTITGRDGKKFEGTLSTHGGRDQVALTGTLLRGGAFEWTYVKIIKGHGTSRNIVGDVKVLGAMKASDLMVAEFRWPIFGSTPRTNYVKMGTLRLQPSKDKDD